MRWLASTLETRVFVAVSRGLWDLTAKDILVYAENLHEGGGGQRVRVRGKGALEGRGGRQGGKRECACGGEAGAHRQGVCVGCAVGAVATCRRFSLAAWFLPRAAPFLVAQPRPQSRATDAAPLTPTLPATPPQGAWRGRQNASLAVQAVDGFFKTQLTASMGNDLQDKDLLAPQHSERAHKLLAENLSGINHSYDVY